VISAFRPKVDDICILLGYYAAYSGKSLPTFRGKLLIPFSRVKKSFDSLNFLTHKGRIDRVSRNFGKDLPIYPA